MKYCLGQFIKSPISKGQFHNPPYPINSDPQTQTHILKQTGFASFLLLIWIFGGQAYNVHSFLDPSLSNQQRKHGKPPSFFDVLFTLPKTLMTVMAVVISPPLNMSLGNWKMLKNPTLNGLVDNFVWVETWFLNEKTSDVVLKNIRRKNVFLGKGLVHLTRFHNFPILDDDDDDDDDDFCSLN